MRLEIISFPTKSCNISFYNECFHLSVFNGYYENQVETWKFWEEKKPLWRQFFLEKFSFLKEDIRS